jgi:hypothetical protein
MAQGDFTLFQAFLDASTDDDTNGQQIDFEGDVFKIALIKSAANGGDDPDPTDPAPAWSGGTTNFSGSQVTPGGNYTTGGATISGPTVTRTTVTSTFNDDNSNVSWAQDAINNPTNARWGILYDDSTTIKHAVGYYDLGSDFDMTTGDLTITFSSNGIIQWAIQTSVAYSA